MQRQNRNRISEAQRIIRLGRSDIARLMPVPGTQLTNNPPHNIGKYNFCSIK